MKHAWLVSVLIVSWVAGAAFAQETAPKQYALCYNPQAELVVQQQLNADVDKVSMENNPLGIAGWMKSNLQCTVTALDAATQRFTMTLALSDIQQAFNGQMMDGSKEACMVLQVSPLGEVEADIEQLKTADLTKLDQAGIPSQLLAVLCHLVRFPEHPVAIGEQWEVSPVLQLAPDTDPLALNVTTQLVGVKEEREASLLSQLSMFVPSFKAPNPLGYGGPVPIKNGELTVTDLAQTFDMQSGVVTAAAGKARFKAQVDMGGFPLNVQVDWSLAMRLRPEADQPTTDIATQPTTAD